MKATDITEDIVIRARAELCRRSFFCFVKEFWEVIIQEDPIYNWHIPYICEELQKLTDYVVKREAKPYDVIINIPPGTTKSTIVSVMWNAWIWTRDPSIRIITNSYSGDLSIELATKTKDIVESEKYSLYFPEVSIRNDKSGKQHYETTAGGFRYATSTGATVTGYHAHIIINDDPVNPKQANSDKMRQMANEHTKTLSSRKVNKQNTPTVTIMQRLHDEDVTGYLLKRKGENIKHICLPAELSDNVSPSELKKRYIDGLLDPSRLGREVLSEAKTDLGGRQYAGQYDQRPVIDGGNIVKEEWLHIIPLSEFKSIRYKEPVHFFLDTAYDARKANGDNDPSGIIAACRIGTNIYITKAQKVWKEFPNLLRFLPEFLYANDYDNMQSSLRIEPKANGKSVCQQLREMTDLNVSYTPTPSDSKEMRLHAVSPKIEAGRVFLVEGDWNDEFITEVTGFPNVPHDEYVDILGYAINYLFSTDDIDDSDLDDFFEI